MASRRAMLAAMGGLPFARPDQHYEPPDGAIVPGARSVLRAREIIITPGSGNANGLFVYDGPAAFDSLIASITAANVHDSKGNLTLAPMSIYDPTGSPVIVMNFSGEGMGWATAATEAGPWSVIGSFQTDHSGDFSLAGTTFAINVTGLTFVAHGVSISAGGLAVVGGITADTEAISSGQAGGLLLQVTNTTGSPTAPNVRITSQTAGDTAFAIRVAGDSFNRVIVDDNGTTGGRIRAGSGAVAPDVALYRAAANEWAGDYAAFNNAGSAETWQTVGGTGAAFAGTWANAAAPGVNLKYRRNMAPYKSVHWVGRVTNTVAQAAGSQITAAVAAAYTPSNTHDITCFNLTSGAVVRVSIGSTGILTCQSAIAANDVVGIPDTIIGLDA